MSRYKPLLALSRRIPALRRRYDDYPCRPGCSFFDRGLLAWLSDERFRDALPFPLHLLRAHRRFIRVTLGGPYVIGGPSVLRAACAASSLIGRNRPVRLEIEGKTIFLDITDPRALYVPNEFWLKTAPQQSLPRLLSPGDTLVDVGANYGTFSVIAAPLVGPQGLVVAIEPQPGLAKLVDASLRANQARYRVHPIACGDEERTATFYVPNHTSGSAGLFRDFSGSDPHETFPVNVRRFDDAVDWKGFPGRVLLKLDVEGSELAFLSGAAAMITSYHPRILMELNPPAAASAGHTIADLRERLLELGYSWFTPLEDDRGRCALDELEDVGFMNVLVESRFEVGR